MSTRSDAPDRFQKRCTSASSVSFASPVSKAFLGHKLLILFPDERRSLPHARALNVLLRTGHIMAAGLLLGGHVFGAPVEQLRLLLYAAIATGAGMIALDLYAVPLFMFEGRGLSLAAKLGLLCLVPFAWQHRIPLLLVVMALASIGSHMPGKFRHYSLLYGRTRR